MSLPTKGIVKWAQFETLQHHLPRVIDLGIVNAVDLIAGPMTLYTPPTPQYVRIAVGDDFVATDHQSLMVVQNILPLIGPLHALSRIGNNPLNAPSQGSSLNELVSSLAIIASLQGEQSGLYVDRVPGVWQSNHAYVGVIFIIVDGHLWSSLEGTDGTSDSSEPDFAGNEGGTVLDNDITWTDEGELPTQGYIHLYALVSEVLS